ncbi:hypothetical protein G9A89_000714 [Geosiphon pyriformis]|nr:hypothetical protein G9A89_000714 [Geosiphon pyriformis]
MEMSFLDPPPPLGVKAVVGYPSWGWYTNNRVLGNPLWSQKWYGEYPAWGDGIQQIWGRGILGTRVVQDGTIRTRSKDGLCTQNLDGSVGPGVTIGKARFVQMRGFFGTCPRNVVRVVRIKWEVHSPTNVRDRIFYGYPLIPPPPPPHTTTQSRLGYQVYPIGYWIPTLQMDPQWIPWIHRIYMDMYTAHMIKVYMDQRNTMDQTGGFGCAIGDGGRSLYMVGIRDWYPFVTMGKMGGIAARLDLTLDRLVGIGTLLAWGLDWGMVIGFDFDWEGEPLGYGPYLEDTFGEWLPFLVVLGPFGRKAVTSNLVLLDYPKYDMSFGYHIPRTGSQTPIPEGSIQDILFRCPINPHTLGLFILFKGFNFLCLITAVPMDPHQIQVLPLPLEWALRGIHIPTSNTVSIWAPNTKGCIVPILY